MLSHPATVSNASSRCSLLATGPKTLGRLAQAVYAGEGPDTLAAGQFMLSAHLEALLEEGRITRAGDAGYVLV